MKKQLIFLMTDTTRKDMVGCYGNPRIKTPNLDRLAEEGIRQSVGQPEVQSSLVRFHIPTAW